MTVQVEAAYSEGRAQVIARRIRGLMGEQRVTALAAARQLHMSHTAFGRRRNGEVEFSITEIEFLAKTLGVSEAYLFGFSETRNPQSMESTRGNDEEVRHQGLEPRTRWLTPALSGNVFEIDAYRGSGTVTSRPGRAVLTMVPA